MAVTHVVHAGGTAAVGGWLLTVVVVTVPSVVYLRAVRSREAAGRTWSAWRTTAFLTGIGLVSAAVSPVVQMHAHGPVGHVIQHLLLGMFAPIALVLAAPATLLLGVLPVGRRAVARAVMRSRVVHGITHPATAALLDVGALYLLHLTPLYAATSDPLAHHLLDLHVLAAGYLFSWSIAGPDPAPRRPSRAVRVGVLIAAGAAHGHLAKLLYANGTQLPIGNGHSAEEVQAAVQLMYYAGDVAELVLAVALFASWY